jgi:Cof subfamily protein (haloacid dehalogenase superfamily)
VLIVTGRMFRSARPYLAAASITEPAVCYQGAAVVDPVSGTFLVHEPIELELARDVIGALAAIEQSPNVYVDDELYVAEHTEYSRAYADFQHLSVTEVGDLQAWLPAPPTKIVTVAKPEQIPEIKEYLAAEFSERLFLTRSLPFLLEISNPKTSKGAGLTYVSDRLGLDLERIVAFGDGENDIELLEAAGFGIAIEGADASLLAVADATCDGPVVEGVAALLEAALDSAA